MKKVMSVAVAAIGIFFLIGNQEIPPTIVRCDIYIDMTCLQDQAFITEQIQSDVLNWLDIDDYQHVSRTGIEITIRAIGNDMFPHVYSSTLDTAPGFWMRNDHERRIETQKFVEQEIPAKLEAVFTAEIDTSKTFLYQPIIESMPDLIQSNADQRFIICYSDGLENGLVSFYDYRDNPAGLQDNFEIIKSELDSLYGVCPALGDIDIILRHHPNTTDMELFSYARRFMHRYFTSHEAQFVLNPI